MIQDIQYFSHAEQASITIEAEAWNIEDYDICFFGGDKIIYIGSSFYEYYSYSDELEAIDKILRSKPLPKDSVRWIESAISRIGNVIKESSVPKLAIFTTRFT